MTQARRVAVGDFDLVERGYSQARSENVFRASNAGAIGKTMYNELRVQWRSGETAFVPVSVAGNSYTWAPPGEDRLVRLRPDWTTIVSERVRVGGGGWYRRPLAYWHEPRFSSGTTHGSDSSNASPARATRIGAVRPPSARTWCAT